MVVSDRWKRGNVFHALFSLHELPLHLLQQRRLCERIQHARSDGLAANTNDLCATPDIPIATICQEWPGIPRTHVAVLNSMVGACQLTSPTSVEPPITSPLPHGSGTLLSITTPRRLCQSSLLALFNSSTIFPEGIVSCISPANMIS